MLEFQPQVNFKEFTRESMSNIRERILNEKLRFEIEQEELNANLDNLSLKKRKLAIKKLKTDRENLRAKPNKDFVIGKQLPLRYKYLFPTKLFGTPIEEIDEFYRNDYVLISIFLL